MSQREELSNEIRDAQSHVAKLNEHLVRLRALKLHRELRKQSHSLIDQRITEFHALRMDCIAKMQLLLDRLSGMRGPVVAQKKGDTRFRREQARQEKSRRAEEPAPDVRR